jgi:YVTN family beta-propeller protein
VLAAVAAGVLAAVAATAALLARGSDSEPPIVVPNTIVKIDAATNEIVDVFAVGRDPGKVAVAGPYVFVTSERDKTLSRIDSRTGEVASNGEAGADAGLAAAGDRYLWVASVSRGEITWMDAERLVAIDRVRLDPHLLFAFLAVGGGSLWLSQYPASATSRYALRTLTLERKYPLGYAETPVEITYGYGAAWVALGSSNALFRIDARDGRTSEIPVGDKPSDPAAGFGSIWVAGYGDGSLWRVDAVTEQPRSIVDVTAVPFGIAVGGGSVWVTDNCFGTVSRVDPETNDVVATIPTGYAPRWLAAGDDAVWVGIGEEPYEPCR